MTRRAIGTSALTVWLAVALAACAGAPRQRAIPAADVNTGPGSLEFVRRQLAGNWEIVAYEWLDADGTWVSQDTSGTLTYDEFGNLSITGTIMGRPGQSDQEVDFSGRAVIDTANQLLRLLDINDRVALDVPDALDPVLPRRYEFDGPLLRLTTTDGGGRETGRTVWRRRQTGAL